MSSKKPTIASLTARIAELEAELAHCMGLTVEQRQTATGLTRNTIAGIGHHGVAHNFTPSAVDAIRLFTWAAKAQGMAKADIIVSLIDQQFTPATVRARVARIFAGTDESCYSEEIRARLGLDEMDEVEDAEDIADALSDEDADAYDDLDTETEEGEEDAE